MDKNRRILSKVFMESRLTGLPSHVWDATLYQVRGLFQKLLPEGHEDYEEWITRIQEWSGQLFPDYTFERHESDAERYVAEAVRILIEGDIPDDMVSAARKYPEYLQAALYRIKQARLYAGWGAKNFPNDHDIRKSFTFRDTGTPY
jgi:predicted hydrolase (HD superfamily)